MKLHTLKPQEGSVHKSKRLGRGEASGKGGTSTKGNKGQQSRSGYSRKLGHEGGQMPIQRRVPKRGFKNINRIEYKVFNLGDIDDLVANYELKEVSLETLYLNKLISQNDRIKLLAKGELKTAKVDLIFNAASKKAKELATQAGCKLRILNEEIEEKVEEKK